MKDRNSRKRTCRPLTHRMPKFQQRWGLDLPSPGVDDPLNPKRDAQRRPFFGPMRRPAGGIWRNTVGTLRR